MPFDSSVDALMYALRESAYTGHAVKILYSVSYTRNGLKHCGVQVTHGYTGYSIDAYGEEADELCSAAKKYSSKPVAVVSASAIL